MTVCMLWPVAAVGGVAAGTCVLLGIECHLTCDMLLVADTGDMAIELLFNLKMIIFSRFLLKNVS